MSAPAMIHQQYPLVIHKLGDSADVSPPLVMLHGWGSNSQTWQPLVQQLNSKQPVWLVDLPGFDNRQTAEPLPNSDQLLQLLADALPPHCHLLGWSLGGMLATAFAANYPQRVVSLCCIATNLSFQAREHWPDAMDQATFSTFKQNFAANPVATLKRFRSLQAMGDQHERQVIKTLSQLSPSPTDHWLASLALLGELDNTKLAQSLTMPCLYLFGENDQLVPATAAQAISQTTPIQVDVIAGCGHTPHLSYPRLVTEQLTQLHQRLGQQPHHQLNKQPPKQQLNKQQVAQSFGRCASTYDNAAHLQRAVGNQLFKAIDDTQQPTTVVDMGCGTGYFSEKLHRAFATPTIIGIDLSEGMTQFASQHQSKAVGWACGDAEQMPLADQSVDLFFSNLAIQWCELLDRLAKETYRVLSPGGHGLISTLGPSTLSEMRTAWQTVDGFVHVNQFVALKDLAQYFLDAGFSQANFRTEIRKVYYADVFILSRELKALGAHNVNTGRHKGMTGRQRLQQFAKAYETFREPANSTRNAGLLPATWEVIYCELIK